MKGDLLDWLTWLRAVESQNGHLHAGGVCKQTHINKIMYWLVDEKLARDLQEPNPVSK
jgi:hypothetical protein